MNSATLPDPLMASPAGTIPLAPEPEAPLFQIIDSVEAGFALFDAEDRLVVANRRYRELYPLLAPVLLPGTPHEDILGHGLRHGQFPDAHGAEGDWLSAARHLPGDHPPAQERRLHDGRAIRVITTRTALGGWVEAHHDITPLRMIEPHHTDIIDSAHLATWELDIASDVMRVNPRWAAIIGHEPGDLPDPFLSAHWRERVHPEDIVLVDDAFYNGAGRGMDVIETEYRIRHRDGSWVWVMDRSRILVRDAAGNPVFMAGIEIDISERKAREQALIDAKAALEQALADRRSAEERFHDIAAASGAWFWEQDADLRFSYRSHTRGAAQSGLFHEGMIGITHAEWAATHPDVLESADWQSVFDAQNARQPFEDFVFRAPRGDGGHGREQWLRISGSPVFDEDGLFRGYRGVGTDVTELHLARRRAEESSKAKSAFLASMSHEIRTPLNGVLGMAEVLERSLATDDKRRMAQTIRRSGQLLLTILNDILDLSKIEAGKLEIEQVAFVAGEVARRAHGLHAAIAAEKGIDLELMVANGLHGMRLGDPLRVQQILNNLLSNATKFTDEGEVTIRLSGRAGRPLTIEVRDTGIGMTPEQLSRIKEEFTQADSTITRRYGGTGLGTSIVYRLVGLMGGEVSMTSAPGEGTTVRVVLPLPDAAERSDPGEPAAPPPVADLGGLRLMVADDNETNLLVMQLILTGCGAEVVSTGDGAAAVAAWAPGAYDAILLDIAMPVMDGPGALARIRALEEEHGLPPAPILAVTANAMPHQVADYIARGFDACIAKPVSAAELSTAIATLMGMNGTARTV